MENLPCITVGMLKHQLASLPDDTKVYAWAPGSHCPVAGVIHYKNPSGEKCLHAKRDATGKVVGTERRAP